MQCCNHLLVVKQFQSLNHWCHLMLCTVMLNMFHVCAILYTSHNIWGIMCELLLMLFPHRRANKDIIVSMNLTHLTHTHAISRPYKHTLPSSQEIPSLRTRLSGSVHGNHCIKIGNRDTLTHPSIQSTQTHSRCIQITKACPEVFMSRS